MINNNEQLKGSIMLFWAFFIYGITPIYFIEFKSVNSIEILVHRIVWSAVILGIWLSYKKKMNTVLSYMKDKKIAIRHFFSGLFLGSNWLIFIYAMHLEKLLEGSIAYYIAPFMTIAFGFLFFKERLNRSKTLSVILIAVAIGYEIVRLEHFPIYAISIALPLYAICHHQKKYADRYHIITLYRNGFFTLPIVSLLWLYLYISGDISFDLAAFDYDTTLLLFAGIITICPLLLLGYGMSKVPLYMNAFLQYVGPTVSFLVAITLYDKEITLQGMVTFLLIWTALAIFIWDTYKQIKRFPHSLKRW